MAETKHSKTVCVAAEHIEALQEIFAQLIGLKEVLGETDKYHALLGLLDPILERFDRIITPILPIYDGPEEGKAENNDEGDEEEPDAAEGKPWGIDDSRFGPNAVHRILREAKHGNVKPFVVFPYQYGKLFDITASLSEVASLGQSDDAPLCHLAKVLSGNLFDLFDQLTDQTMKGDEA